MVDCIFARAEETISGAKHRRPHARFRRADKAETAQRSAHQQDIFKGKAHAPLAQSTVIPVCHHARHT